MRIKKFNELFDTDELKSQHEIDFLQGKDILQDINIPIDFKNEPMSYLMHKLAKFNFPFLGIFFENPEGYKFKDCEISISDMEDGFWIFVIKSGKKIVSIGLKINKTSDYNIFIYTENGTKESENGVEFNNLNYREIVNIIKNEYIPILANNFDDILTYGGDTSEVNN